MTNMKKCNYVISVVAALLGGGILLAAAKLGIGFKAKGGIRAGTWPAIMGGILLAAAVCLLCMTVFNRKKYEEMEVALALPANMRVYILMGIFAVYCIIAETAGMYLSAAVLIPTVMTVVGERNGKKMAAVTAGTLLGIFVIFGLILGTRLPEPIWI
ncbi:tripartite tricarboxylate transporter TctB family protein [Clostridium sp. AM58-1XD]|uniref:tripartite tricarboxylate transporter TctB family protein n=1 Tax=Clostridium sp. AM58-1XD TaxID=2292307 RepID=UPI0015F751BD|nr:tripartite tricarboxylate transporter TctB family protein [Clostridium sp. AM58-1XD]